jgi:hypothetical protein
MNEPLRQAVVEIRQTIEYYERQAPPHLEEIGVTITLKHLRAILAALPPTPSNHPPAGGAEAVAYLIEWSVAGDPRRRVQLNTRLEPWLEQYAPKITPLGPLYAHPPQDQGHAGAGDDLDGLREAELTELGRITWHSSGEDEGPDVGVELGLGGGFSLYCGELAERTLADLNVDLSRYPDGWWTVLWGPGVEIVLGAVPDHYEARDALDHIAGCLALARTASGERQGAGQGVES